jgi:hypothetical protein
MMPDWKIESTAGSAGGVLSIRARPTYTTINWRQPPPRLEFTYSTDVVDITGTAITREALRQALTMILYHLESTGTIDS